MTCVTLPERLRNQHNLCHVTYPDPTLYALNLLRAKPNIKPLDAHPEDPYPHEWPLQGYRNIIILCWQATQDLSDTGLRDITVADLSFEFEEP